MESNPGPLWHEFQSWVRQCRQGQHAPLTTVTRIHITLNSHQISSELRTDSTLISDRVDMQANLSPKCRSKMSTGSGDTTWPKSAIHTGVDDTALYASSSDSEKGWSKRVCKRRVHNYIATDLPLIDLWSTSNLVEVLKDLFAAATFVLLGPNFTFQVQCFATW